jgi:radical SAM protein with 4Fe4S-binding SPASM domain
MNPFIIKNIIEPVVKYTLYPIQKHRLKKHFNMNPKFIKIETTNLCNGKCSYCPNKTMSRKRGIMSDETFRLIILDAKKLKVKEIHLQNFGEPLVDKKIFERINHIKQTTDMKVIIFTNGSLLTDDNIKKLIDSDLDEIKISFDGFSKEYFEKYRKPFKFHDIKLKIIALKKEHLKSNSKLKICLNVVYDSTISETQIDKLKHEWIDIVGLNNIYFQKVHNWADTEIKNHKFRKMNCRDMFEYMTILWNGDVVPCCLDYEGFQFIGNVTNEPLNNIWFGRNFSIFRYFALINKRYNQLCQKCSLPCQYKYPYLDSLRWK